MIFEVGSSYCYPGAWVYSKKWKHYAIFILADKKYCYGDMYVGISWYGEQEPNKQNKIFKKDYKRMNCLCCEPDEGWPYGWEYLPDDIRNWNHHITEDVIKGRVANFIKTKFDEILQEIETGKLPMP